MASVGKSAAALRIYGDDLIPDEVTKVLGCVPTSAERKGQIIRSSSGRERTARTGGWDLTAPDSKPENLDQQVSWLLDQLTDDLSVWCALAERYRIDLFCGLFMHTSDEGLTLAPKTLVALGVRGIELGLCLYPPLRKDSDGAA